MSSIRWKLMLMNLLVVLLPVYALNRYAVSAFDAFTRRSLEDGMIAQGLILGEAWRQAAARERDADAAADDFKRVLAVAASNLQARVQVLDASGRVRADSEPNGEEGADLSAHAGVAAALAGGYDAGWSLTPDRRYVYYDVPVAIRQGDGVVGVVRLVRHTGDITAAIARMHRHQQRALFASLAAAAVIAALLAQTMTGRIRRLIRSVTRYARGDAPPVGAVRGRDEIAELARTVVRMADELERRGAYNRDAMSAVLHELRTPVTAIRGAVELLESGAADRPEPRRRFLNNIRFEAERLARLVGELGVLTRLDAETLRGQKQRLDYGACVRDILDRLLPTFDQPHAAFALSLPEGEIPVRIVPGRIEQVLSNLLENAFRYTPADGRVELAVTVAGGRVSTAVTDSGCGVPAENLERIFERFYTTEPKDVPREYGSGLGLAIARSIVTNHEGRIRAERPAEGGTRIVFELPAIA